MALLCLMLSRRIPAVLAGVLIGSLLAVPRGSARKYSRATGDEGSPAGTTGDWFDTTYDLVVLR